MGTHEDFVCVKNPMGLEPFEATFLLGQKFTNFDLALKQGFKNQWVGGFRFTYFYSNF